MLLCYNTSQGGSEVRDVPMSRPVGDVKLHLMATLCSDFIRGLTEHRKYELISTYCSITVITPGNTCSCSLHAHVL